MSTLRDALKAWLLARWAGVARAPAVTEVLMLSSIELKHYDPGELLFVGESRGAACSWRCAMPHVLHLARLAKELQPASERLGDAAAAELQWKEAVRLSEVVRLKSPGSDTMRMIDSDSTLNYGRHSRTLRVHEGHPPGQAGHFPFGQYENVHHETRTQMVPSETRAHLDMVLAVFMSLAPLPLVLIRPRCQLIRNCSTVEHSDRQRGDTVSGFRFDSFGIAALLVRTDIFMCVSLCKYRGILVIPMCMRSTSPPEVVVYCWDMHTGEAREGLVPYSALETDEWERIGMLDCVVFGLDDGWVMTAERADSERPGMGARRACDLKQLTPGEAMVMARQNPHPTFSHKWVCIGWDARWNGLYGWMLVHAFAGDGSVLRFHVYSRSFEEHPSCATVNRRQYDLSTADVQEFVSL